MGKLALASAAVLLLGLLAGTGAFGFRAVQLSSQLNQLEEEIAAAVLTSFPDVNAEKLDEPSMALAIMQEQTLATTGRVDALGGSWKFM